MRSWKPKTKFDIYIAVIIISSTALTAFALGAVLQQYSFSKHFQNSKSSLSFQENVFFSSLSQANIIILVLIVLSLVLMLIIGIYLSGRDIKRQLEIAKLKNDFVSTVSHELKTPLTSIRLLAERLLKLKSQDIEKLRQYHSLILTQTLRLSHLINNVLDFSKLEKDGQEKYNFERNNLSEIIYQSIEDYPVKSIRRDCKLKMNISDNLPFIYLDKETIARAFINLLDNALKFSPKGGIININIGKKTAQEVFIEVIDQGPGIPKNEKIKIFGQFYHIGKGTGLGLALVQNIVKDHNGKIEVESKKGHGSIFRIILPVKDNKGA